MWKPSSVEDIRAWSAGDYVLNPTAKEWYAQLRERTRVNWGPDWRAPTETLHVAGLDETIG